MMISTTELSSDKSIAIADGDDDDDGDADTAVVFILFGDDVGEDDDIVAPAAAPAYVVCVMRVATAASSRA
jgi:hypothetical protein